MSKEERIRWIKSLKLQIRFYVASGYKMDSTEVKKRMGAIYDIYCEIAEEYYGSDSD